MTEKHFAADYSQPRTDFKRPIETSRASNSEKSRHIRCDRPSNIAGKYPRAVSYEHRGAHSLNFPSSGVKINDTSHPFYWKRRLAYRKDTVRRCGGNCKCPLSRSLLGVKRT